tara:strand:- start:1535 stop:1723 length:189 start_codon:yes stop_codon:yes gene_type:complete
MTPLSEFKVGDLVRAKWLGWTGIVVGHNAVTETGESWWQVYNTSEGLHRVIGEWDLTVLSCK